MPEPAEIKDRLARAQVNLGYSVDNAMSGLGSIGRAKGRDLLEAISDELGEIMDFIGGDDA